MVSHTAARLANALTPGEKQGNAYQPPTSNERQRVVADLLAGDGPVGGRPVVTARDGESLTETAARLRTVFESVAIGDLALAAWQVNQLLVETGARPQLDYYEPDGWSLHFHGKDDSVAIGWAAGFASGLALAIGSDFVGRLGVCEAIRCDRVYVDASRNGAKRFCSTSCQNRVKAAVFRSRHSART
ncbi:MAG: CGNR zinc finger domain-containing protein [Nocardioidaceae bacterium]